MTQDEMIELANKAFDESSFTDAEVLRFAKLVAEKEREACAKVCDEADKNSDWPTAANCAEAIRARGQDVAVEKIKQHFGVKL